MHPYELKIVDFMQKVSTQSVAISDDLLQPAVKSIEYFMRKMYEEDPKKSFSLRLSQIGRPLCQQQMAQAKAPALQDEWNNPLRMFFGAVIEATAVCILKAAGINIEEEQGNVKLLVRTANNKVQEIPGTFDLLIDGRMWDVKSASPYNFGTKFSSYSYLKANDEFGYLPQLYGYAEARGVPAGGWIVVDKSSGLVKILEVPSDLEASDRAEQLQAISANVEALVKGAEFKRCYDDIDEKFKKRYTGSKYIDSPCTFCSYRYSCWPSLQYLPNQSSTAFEKTYRHYTQLGVKSLDENPISESEGTTITTKSGTIDLSRIFNAG